MKVKQDKLIKLINNNNSFHTIINRVFLNNQQIKHHHIVFLNCRQKLNHIFDIKNDLHIYFWTSFSFCNRKILMEYGI